MEVASINDRKTNGDCMVIASKRNSSGDESLRKLILLVVLIFLLYLGMVSTIVYADDGGSGGSGGNGGNGGHGSSDGGHASSDGGHASSGEGNNGDGSGTGHGIGGSSGNSGGKGGHGNGNGNEGNAMVKEGRDQKSTSDFGSKTVVLQVVVQHTISMHAVQASVVVLLVASYAEAASSISAAWWIQVESNAERLLRKFFFLAGSVGERIRRENVLENRKRREIYRFVVNNPFSHFRRITRMAGVGPNEGSWHLRILEKLGLITSEYVGRYLTYHANNSDQISSRGNQLISLITNSNATKILEYLLRNPGVKIAHLTQALKINRNTISYHIKRMQTNGLVERVGRKGLRLSKIMEKDWRISLQAPSLQENEVRPNQRRFIIS